MRTHTPVEALRLLLDQVDYIKGNCGPTEMVAAVLPKEVIEICRQVLAEASPVLTGTGESLATPDTGAREKALERHDEVQPMTPEQRAREFVSVGFRDLGVPSLEPYIAIIAELIAGAEKDILERAATFNWRGVPTSNIPGVIRALADKHEGK